MNNRKGIVAFILIAFGIAWLNWEVVLRSGIAIDNPLFKILAMPSAFAPAIAAFIVRKWITREGFGDAGLAIDVSKWRYYLIGWLLPLVAVGCIVILAPLFGLAKPDFTLIRGLKQVMPGGVPPALLAHPWLLVLGLPVNAIFATPILFGEEFGWRGYLQLRLFPEQPLLSAIGTGVIWGIWHYPVNLRGYNYPDHRILGLLVFPVATVLISIIFGWLRLKSNSIWCSSLAHAATNGMGGTLFLLLLGGSGGDYIYISLVGVLGYVPLGLLSAWIIATGQLKPAAPPQMQADRSQAAQSGA
ncbi:MAG TPA: CPBP family intramembrane glutamic endopeptidase [Terriglobales bacterium]|jgi:membrane protease YdiL (CAAX protease family)|nr:CPBP family intramembrane glutamic endopeptidase [Terriglobales bacterium]